MSVEESNRIGRAAERMRRRSRASMKVMLPTAAALGAGAAVAIGQIPGSDATITACYQDVSQGVNGADGPFGTLRIIDPSAASNGDPTWPNNACGPNEHIITWNQHGPPGIPGSVGARGPMGPPGAVLGNTSFSVSASKTDRLLVKLDGISGGVSQKGFKGDVELSSFAIGEETAVGTVGGAGNGVAIQSFSFVKKPDRADPELVAHVTEGRAIKLADVQVLHVSKGAQPVEVADYKLTGVLLKSLQQKGATEVITGTFQKLTGSVGTGTNKVSTGWNVITNKAP